MRTAFIGGGVMAEAMLSRAIAQHVLAPGDVCVAEPIEARAHALAKTYGISTVSANLEAASGASMIVLAVKPQHMPAVLHDLRARLDEGQTALSIAAGITIDTLVNGLSHGMVVRVMPNTPAQVGAGVSVWTATELVTSGAKAYAATLLGAMGREFYVTDESFLDMATAVSGSGPGYVFAFIESLTDAAVQLGIPRAMAASMVLETVYGSTLLAKESGEHPAVLRERVTSPGGTTSEGLRALEQGRFRTVVMDAVAAAHAKAQALGAQAIGAQTPGKDS